MEEETAKKLIQKSIVNTSEDFTDKLLLKIKVEKEKPITDISSVQLFRYPVLAMIGGGVVFFIVLLIGFLPKLEVFNHQLQLNRTPFLIILLFLLFMSANHFLRLQSFINNENRN